MLHNYIEWILNKSPHPVIFIISMVILWASSITILTSVIYKFVEINQTKKQKMIIKRHFIETYSMSVIIVTCFNLLQINTGFIKTDWTTHLFFFLTGLFLVILGTWLHLWSKIAIGKYWSNQIEIVEGHKIITSGPFAIVRHPAYSSLILWMTGLSFIFTNALTLAITFLLFFPLMIIRAKAEDKQLMQQDNTVFKRYAEKTHLLIPRFNRWISLGLKIMIIILFSYSVISRQMELSRVLYISLSHFITGLIIQSNKTRFAYRNKAFFILGIYGLSLLFAPVYYLYFLIIIFNIWGLFFNCPCMFVYEKFHGCPCFGWMKKCVVKK